MCSDSFFPEAAPNWRFSFSIEVAARCTYVRSNAKCQASCRAAFCPSDKSNECQPASRVTFTAGQATARKRRRRIFAKVTENRRCEIVALLAREILTRESFTYGRLITRARTTISRFLRFLEIEVLRTRGGGECTEHGNTQSKALHLLSRHY